MSEIVNLNKARKARQRDVDKASAAENRSRFGRTKAEKVAAKLAEDMARRALDGAKREP